MKTSSSSVVIVLLLIVLALGYAVFLTRPTADDIQLKVNEISGQAKPIDTGILDSEGVKSLAGLRIFGSRPVDPAAGTVSRRNPFDGI